MYSTSSQADELLKLELSLDPRDLRAHAWYHGSIPRLDAEILLQNNGDFLVRDCTSASNPGDFVLSCRWRNCNLHFLIHKDVLHQDTIYEKLVYKFEYESFDTISDLITYHVGSGKPISVDSGALISHPRVREMPIIEHDRLKQNLRNDYATLKKHEGNSVAETTHVIQKQSSMSTLDRSKQKSLNLNPPPGLLEELTHIPRHISEIAQRMDDTKERITGDVDCTHSILLPTDCKNPQMDKHVFKMIIGLFLETSERLLALHLTRADCECLFGSNFIDSGESHLVTNMYDVFLDNSEYRWTCVVERSLVFSYFVVTTIYLSDSPEVVVDKWIKVAGELKTGLGNFFGFCAILRGLLMPQITNYAKVNWGKLRREFTNSAFSFETSYRTAYQNLVKGIEPYPPNTTIPELSTVALILEDALGLLCVSCIAAEENQLQFFNDHLSGLRSLMKTRECQMRNIKRSLLELQILDFDVILSEIFLKDLHLQLLLGANENEMSLKEKCQAFEDIIMNM